MSKFIRTRVIRIEKIILSDLEKLSNNLDTLLQFYKYNAIPAKIAYKRAQRFAGRFDVLINRLHNALAAANNFDKNNRSTDPDRYEINNGRKYCEIYHKIVNQLEYFGL